MILVEICLHCLQVFHHFHFLIIIIIIIITITTMTVFYHLQLIYIFHIQVASQETFILMKTSSKTSWSRRIYSPYSCVFSRGHTSSRRLKDMFKTSYQDVLKRFPRRPQDIFKTSSRCFENVFKTSSRHLQDVFKTFSRRIIKLNFFGNTTSRRLRDAFKTFLRQLSTGGLPRSHFWDIYGQCTKFPRVITFNFSL